MDIFENACFIGTGRKNDPCAPLFRRRFTAGTVNKATLHITALGLYEAFINGKRVGNRVFTPGWTVPARLQYQSFDVTDLIEEENDLDVLVGNGWHNGRFPGWIQSDAHTGVALLATLELDTADGVQTIVTGPDWELWTTGILINDLYDGETVDARILPEKEGAAVLYTGPVPTTIFPDEGEPVVETAVIRPARSLTTPKGERVIDFGQNLTGYVRFRFKGAAGEVLSLSYAEVLDKDGNFYTENYRSAKSLIRYTGSGADAVVNPHFSFQGFRFIRLDQCPAGMTTEDFEAVVVHSRITRTGTFHCSDPLVNRLFENILWGQRGNFLDVPTDCPQRDERLGWTGDAQAFAKVATYNYNVNRFFRKWLHDMILDQRADGGIPVIIPDVLPNVAPSAAWGDACTIIPWQLYVTYGDKETLADCYPMMCRWVDYLHNFGEEEFLWIGGEHYGDWLGLDAPKNSYKGSTDPDLIASAFFAYSTELTIKAGRVLGKDVSAYEALYNNIVAAFRARFMKGGIPTSFTQTSHVLALHFHLTENPAETAASLAEMIHKNGDRLQTGFVGTPYLLHVLSDNGYGDLAYTLLLQKQFPSWLYPVLNGATTMWEHWDGMDEEGNMWPADMNSFNHYAYGAVGDWMYGTAAGIRPCEDRPGFAHIVFAPQADPRLTHAEASIDTKYGTVTSRWEIFENATRYTFRVPEGVTAEVRLNGTVTPIGPGEHLFTLPL